MPSAAKSIAGSLRDTKELCCGLRQKSDAAALLHNAGYVIVDRNNEPVAPPESGDHLIPQADRIRLCARNYYVDPAREAGVAAVSIRAGTLSRDMGLHDAFPAICRALGSEKFQQWAQVPAPTTPVPHTSSPTVFTYKIAAQEGQRSEEHTSESSH